MTALQEGVQQVSPAPALVVDVRGPGRMLGLGRATVPGLAGAASCPGCAGRTVR